MPKRILILGATGRMGRHATRAFSATGWKVSRFDRRAKVTLSEAAKDQDVIFHGWNPSYSDWATQMPDLTSQVISAAKTSGAAVLIPGNVYVFGQQMPPVIGPGVPHRAENALGRIRIEMEEDFRASGVKTVILRAGDFIDTEASGNWFDKVIAAKIRTGRISYPGALQAPHAWAFLPDLAKAFVDLANRLDDLPSVSDLAFEGYTLTAEELAQACGTALGEKIRLTGMSWLPIQLARPFWPMAKHLLEMRYLWNTPHRSDGSDLQAIIGTPHTTDLTDALNQALRPLRT